MIKKEIRHPTSKNLYMTCWVENNSICMKFDSNKLTVKFDRRAAEEVRQFLDDVKFGQFINYNSTPIVNTVNNIKKHKWWEIWK